MKDKCAICGCPINRNPEQDKASAKAFKEEFGMTIGEVGMVDEVEVLCTDCYNTMSPKDHPETVNRTMAELRKRLLN